MNLFAGSVPVLSAQNFQISGFEDKELASSGSNPVQPIPGDSLAAARVSWRPHIDFATAESLMTSPTKDPYDVMIMEEYGLLCSAEILDRIKDVQDSNWHFVKFRKWMEDNVVAARQGQNEIVPYSQKILVQSTQEERAARMAVLDEELKTSPFVHVAELTKRLLQNCVGIFDGSTEVLEVYLKGDALTKLYNLMGERVDASEFFVSAGHSKPSLRILEIGAGTGGTTLIALKALTSINNEPLYAKYTFTDISSGFFSAAKDRFSDYPGLEFRTLDIGKDPGEQGFELGSYDLIVASNVIHATEFLNVTLKNVHRLLSPRGRFFLQELTPSGAKMKNLIMGPLPGWWLGEADGRVDEPIISVERWDSELRAAGFAGIDVVVRDDPSAKKSIGANMVARPAVQEQQYKSITIVIRADQRASNTLSDVQSEFEAKGYFVDVCTLGESLPPNQDIVSLADVDHSFFDEITAGSFAAFQKTIAAMTSTRMLWVMGSAQVKPTSPRFGLTLGLVRCIRAELSLPLATLEVDRCLAEVAGSVLKVFELFLESATTAQPELEYIISDDDVRVGRYHWLDVNKEIQASQDVSHLRVRLTEYANARGETERAWTPLTVATQGPDQITARAMYINPSAGVSSKSCGGLTASNIVKQQHVPVINGLTACGYSGEVIEGGSNVTELKPGDRIMTLGAQGIQNIMVLDAKDTVKIPDGLSIDEAASTALAFPVALYALQNLADVRSKQRVLIAGTESVIGLAAVQIGLLKDAEVRLTQLTSCRTLTATGVLHCRQ
jgi:SAM-dependent methyltransferase